ncbi:MAG: DUF1801 domain-containing protein [Pseudomonadota bacterium]
MTGADPVETYLAALPAPRRAPLTELRALIRAALPHARESLRYKMPTYDGPDGDMLCAFASQKRHMSLYLCEADLVERFRDRLPRIDIGKGCLRFKSLDDLPRPVLDDVLAELGRR